ncbi:MAG TPA: MogA/MoaB family molybdenum cofactor biosynthesis protein [Phycisphaerae bacterium]|nr:MogA/MoaB family molybdenum cofactor biosynthesis protein [Phycisphaerae bacterium]
MTWRVAILTCSDRCSRGEAQDTSSPALAAVVLKHLDAQITHTACVTDDIPAIQAKLREWATGNQAVNLILTTGGTGLSPRDNTPEATLPLLHKRASELLELARLRSLAKTPRAYLSRGEAGLIHRTLVLNLPGSPRGAVEFFEAMVDVLPHALAIARGDAVDHGQCAGPEQG